jgi:hypothetical protein
MREVYLTPEHSSWWLLSPGVTIYYDKLKICKSDFDKMLKAGGQSSYHDQIALHLDAFKSRDDFPEIEIIDDSELPLAKDYFQRADILKNILFKRAADNSDPTLIPKDLVKLTIDAFHHWIEYNKGKVRYLSKGEAYSNMLGSDLIPNWEQRLRSLYSIYRSPDEEILNLFSENPDAISTFKRLLASSSRCIDLIDSGKQIYDPMLVEYLPTIQLIEGRRVTKNLIDKKGDVSGFFEAFNIQMTKYKEILPININLNEVGKNITDYNKIRSNLKRLDSTISSIQHSDLLHSLSDIKNEIGAIVHENQNLSRNIGYGFWVSGLIWTVASFLGGPDLSKKISDGATTLNMMSQGVGKFAGAYSLITDRVILQQDSKLMANSYNSVDYNYFKKHYWDFSKKSV